jgi:hypothetical protein
MVSKTSTIARVTSNRAHASGPAGLIDRQRKSSDSAEASPRSASSPRSESDASTLTPSSPRVGVAPSVLQRGGSKKLPPRAAAPAPRKPSEPAPPDDEFE